MDKQDQPIVVKPTASAAAVNPFAVPVWKRSLYFAGDCVETYLEGFEKLRARHGDIVKGIAVALVLIIVMATVVTMNLRHVTLPPL